MLTTAELLDAWEQGMNRSVTGQALLLLSPACALSFDELAALSIGRRDALLLELRERMFGGQLVCVANCPECGERLELNFETAELLNDQTPEGAEPLNFHFAGYELSFRLPNSLDLMAVEKSADAAVARQQLLERCVISSVQDGEPVTVSRLPAAVIDALSERMRRADPLADIQLALHCPGCQHEWSADFDIASFFLTEINARARRTLREAHMLARAYGWSEKEIFSLSAWRRQFYLNCIGE
ncbi:MAG: phage baseplate protein [Blastocatellia bacterium]